ncbi:MAG: hypothetical protein JWO06_4054 [Bacteroidota bacterium]|nr:hypothetical protein [Bacteroidota bacterium]
MINELIEALTEQERSTLIERINNAPGQLYKFIGLLMQNPDWSQKQVEKHFGINSNTYFKNVSLAKDEIYEVIKMHIRNSYDDLILSNVLYRRGLQVHCNKLRLRLEDEYISNGWWNVLQELYNMQMMVAYTRCDVKWLEELKQKCFDNSDRLHRFTRVDREVIVQMALIEKGDMKEKHFAAYAKNLESILKEAEAVDHPIPVFNALHCFFVLYTQYEVNINKAQTVVEKMDNFLNRYDEQGVLVYARNVALLNLMGFHIDFASGQSAESHFKKVKNSLGKHGMLFDSQVWLNFCVYHFFEKNVKDFDFGYKRFAALPLDTGLQYQADYIACLCAYLHNKRTDFYTHLNNFYRVERTRAHLNYDLSLRYLEIMLLLKEDNLGLASDKLEAAVKFTRRNFTSFRIELEKKHWDLLKAAIKKARPDKIETIVYRFTEFIGTELKYNGSQIKPGAKVVLK